jgi:hypothetical protein
LTSIQAKGRSKPKNAAAAAEKQVRLDRCCHTGRMSHSCSKVGQPFADLVPIIKAHKNFEGYRPRAERILKEIESEDKSDSYSTITLEKVVERAKDQQKGSCGIPPNIPENLDELNSGIPKAGLPRAYLSQDVVNTILQSVSAAVSCTGYTTDSNEAAVAMLFDSVCKPRSFLFIRLIESR